MMGYGVCENNQNTVDYTVVGAGVIDILWLEWSVANSVATYTLYNTSRSSVSSYGHTYGWCPGVRGARNEQHQQMTKYLHTMQALREVYIGLRTLPFLRSSSLLRQTNFLETRGPGLSSTMRWFNSACSGVTYSCTMSWWWFNPPSKRDPTTVLRRTVALFLEPRRVRSATVDSWSSSFAFRTSAKTISHRKSSWSKSLSVCNATEQVPVTLNPLLFSLRGGFICNSRTSRPYQTSPSQGSIFSTYLTDIKKFHYFSSILRDHWINLTELLTVTSI